MNLEYIVSLKQPWLVTSCSTDYEVVSHIEWVGVDFYVLNGIEVRVSRLVAESEK